MIANVRFINSNKNFSKIYSYNIKKSLSLKEGFTCYIIADNETSYSNPVYIESIEKGFNNSLRTITAIKVLDAPKLRTFHKKIIVDKEKETICVIWKNGDKTIMKPQDGDTFDVEKGIALCFMKYMHDNRGAYYNIFKDVEYFERKNKNE